MATPGAMFFMQLRAEIITAKTASRFLKPKARHYPRAISPVVSAILSSKTDHC
jgi:hypothetical protein